MSRAPIFAAPQLAAGCIKRLSLIMLSGTLAVVLVLGYSAAGWANPCAQSTAPHDVTTVQVATASRVAPAHSLPSNLLRFALPELPRATVFIPAAIEASDTIRIGPKDDLQAAINAARPSTLILLRPNATYQGNLVLCAKPQERPGWITIMADPDGAPLPIAGARLIPSATHALPKLIPRDRGKAIIRTELGAHHYRLVGLEITTAAGQTSAGDLVQLGSGGSDQNTVEKIAHDLILDRVYIHAGPEVNVHRCVALNSATTAIVDSWLSECHGAGIETQAIAGWNGPGPFRIENNHLEGSGMGLMFGGATPAIVGLHPADITIRRNHFTRPLSWQGKWSVKNLLELKHAVRVLIEGNVFENNWVDAQDGFALVWKSSAALTGAEWTVTSDVTFRRNIVRNSVGGLNLAAAPDGPAQPASRILIEQNRFENIGTPAGGRMFQVLGALSDVQFTHNTAIFGTGGQMLLSFDGSPMHNFGFQDNVATLGTYGIRASGAASGTASLNQYTQGSYNVTGNVLIGQAIASQYPTGNQLTTTLAGVGFIDLAAGNYALAPSSPYSGSGADMTAIATATAGVVMHTKAVSSAPATP